MSSTGRIGLIKNEVVENFIMETPNVERAINEDRKGS